MWRMVIPVFFLILSCSGSKEQPKEKGEIKEKSTFIEVADFTLPTLYGDTIALGDFKGKVIILDFWATWCGPCTYEMPSFIELQTEYGDAGLQVLGVSLDRGKKEDVVDFCDKLGVNYLILFDDGNVSRQFGIQAIPTTYIIGRGGDLVKKYVGMVDKETLKKDIEPLIK